MRHAASITLGLIISAAVLLAPAIAAGAVYYVDVSGTDTASGAVLSPFRTIGAAAGRAHAGDLVVVRSGVYSESVVLTQSGALGAPIVLRGLPGAVLVSPDPSQSLSAFDVGAGAYVTIQGFEIGGGFDEAVFVRAGAHDIELAGLDVHDNQSGIWIEGAAQVFVHDCVLEHNFRTGIRIFAGAHDIQVADTRAEANDDGQGCDGASDGFNADASTANITFERATAVGNSDDGFDLKGTNAAVLESVAQDNQCTGVKLWAGGLLQNVLVERSPTGVRVTAPAGATTTLENCTLSQNDIGVAIDGSDHTVHVQNSIVTGPAKALTYAAAMTLLEDHNILFRPSPSERLIVRQDDSGEEDYSANDVNDGTWQRASGQGAGTVAQDPDFQPGTCQPGPDSVAIDSGVDANAPALDLAGLPRPVGAAVDRGAFEWTATTPTLTVRRLMLHRTPTGSGSVRLRAEVDASAMQFDPQHDVVTIALRGARGDALASNFASAGWNHRVIVGNARVRLVRTPSAACTTSVALRAYPDRAIISLSARGSDLWALDDGPATVTIEIGRLRATADVTP